MAPKSLLLVLLLMVSLTGSSFACISRDPDACLDTGQLIESRGWISEEHEVETQDGYILTVFRIVNPNTNATTRRPVILQHGLFSSSRDWLMAAPGGNVDEDFDSSSPGNNMGFELAKAGHDVWLSNTRGNTYSLKHISRSHWGSKFWQFSFADMAKYDVPAVVDYILNATGRESVAYVGHSQGTVMMWATLATFEKYNKVIKPIIQMAPSFGWKHMPAVLEAIMHSPIVPLLMGPFDGPFSARSPLTVYMETVICRNVAPACLMYEALIGGSDRGQMNASRTDVFMYGIPAGTSIKNIRHWRQAFVTGKFGEYDYGRKKNMALYGRPDPPPFDLGKITSPNIAIFCGNNDKLASPADVDILRSQLPVKLLMDYTIPFDKWNHFDFLIAMDLGKLVIKPIIQLMDRFEP